jgi:hypothetical protein
VRELGEVRSGLVTVERLERLRRQPVQPYATDGRETFVERVTDEDVGEAKTTRIAGNIGDDACGHCLVQLLEQLVP